MEAIIVLKMKIWPACEILVLITFFFFNFTLYSPLHLTYRGSGMAIPLHALQTTVKVFFWLIVSLAHPFHAPFMQFGKLFWNRLNSREGTIQ